MPFTAAPHHDVLALLIQIAVLLAVARLFGEIAQRLKQPSVVGEILAGIVLGPSLLSGIFPAVGEWIVPQTPIAGHLLEVISLIGALFLLLITGLETDLQLIRRRARTVLGVSLGGIAVPWVTGFALGWYLPVDLVAGGEEKRLVFALFVATAMSISAIPVIAKVLMDMNLMRRDIGQTIIAAGMTDDTIAWVMLSIVAGLAASGTVDAGSVARSVGSVALFMALSFTFGRWLVKRALDYVQDEMTSSDRLVTLVVVLMFAWGSITQAVGLEAVLGAFVMGILFGQMPRLPESVHQKLITVSLAVFTPIFFGVAGLKVDARALVDPRLFGITVVVIAVACIGKIVGSYFGARLVGVKDHWTALSFGAGLNARGAMEIIIATIGLQLGILTPHMFSIIVIMAMVTSLIAPPMLRWTLARITPEEEELTRLRREELAATSLLGHIHRILLPVRQRPTGSPIHALPARLLDRLAAQSPISVTVLNVSPPGGEAEGQAFLDRITRVFNIRELSRKTVESEDPSQEILKESQKHYDLMILGATENSARHSALFHPVVDELVRLAPCSTIVVKGEVGEEWTPRRILVPTNGSMAARAAAELAMLLATEDEEVVALNVVPIEAEPYRAAYGWRDPRDSLANAQIMVDHLRELGEAQGVRTRGEVRQGRDVNSAIIDYCRSADVGLIVLGTNVRSGSERLFLGPSVERLIADAPCPVLVYNK